MIRKTQTTLMFLVIALLAASALGEETRSQEVDKLLKERRDILHQLVEVTRNAYHQGRVEFDAVVRASDELLDAELDLAKDRQERLTVLKKRVELMQNLAKTIEERFAIGSVTHASVLSAKAALLKAKIQLAREQEEPDGSSE